MLEALGNDPVATYAAALSTVIAVLGGGRVVWTWVNSGPSAAVDLFSPTDVRRFERRFMEIVVSNTGKAPIVIREIQITLHNRRWLGSPERQARFYHGEGWDPSLEDVPHPTKPGTTISRTRVIQPGHEVHQLLSPFATYDPRKHWLRAKVFLRNRRAPVVAWSPPQVDKGTR